MTGERYAWYGSKYGIYQMHRDAYDLFFSNKTVLVKFVTIIPDIFGVGKSYSL